jgi:hypothetical protein
MAGGTRSDVALPPDSIGQKVATYTVTRVAADGSLVTEVQQIVTIADETGLPIDLASSADFTALLEVLKDIRALSLVSARVDANVGDLSIDEARELTSDGGTSDDDETDDE